MDEKLKKYQEIHEPDFRSTVWVRIDRNSEVEKHETLRNLYDDIALIELSSDVPDKIKSQFNIARNLGLYTWYCYSFHQICELKAFSSLEFALREKFAVKRPGLKKLLKRAVSEGVLTDSCFSHVEIKDKNSTSYCERLIDVIPALRNDLAHGSMTLHHHSIVTLRKCADMINGLFV
ncbi:hypothetical protein STSP2_00331 [Anaerohalosphaera lusitana]|uniref:RiboL-PSP-HEPN domain-containing protein n=1 Tax=Anaerohalosphaera lusitana TaxID=1936003 RepID=A0A1U9NHF0_9BACT|nr:hypothetical protein [Anaerohalosphaera lusitana]AQT67188.1 hypothetical protein STSP2_00331 [Anaerohalosphaera lusitana]